MVAPFLTRWFFATVVSAIEKTLRQHGHHVLLFDLEDESYDRRLPLSQSMLWKRVDGVITLNLPMTADELELVDRLGLPLVAIGTPVADRPGSPPRKRGGRSIDYGRAATRSALDLAPCARTTPS